MHKDEFVDEPFIGGRCLTPLIEMIKKGVITWDEINKAHEERDIDWKKYHQAKARSLMIEVDADQLRKQFPRNLYGNFHVFE